MIVDSPLVKSFLLAFSIFILVVPDIAVLEVLHWLVIDVLDNFIQVITCFISVDVCIFYLIPCSMDSVFTPFHPFLLLRPSFIFVVQSISNFIILLFLSWQLLIFSFEGNDSWLLFQYKAMHFFLWLRQWSIECFNLRCLFMSLQSLILAASSLSLFGREYPATFLSPRHFSRLIQSFFFLKIDLHLWWLTMNCSIPGLIQMTLNLLLAFRCGMLLAFEYGNLLWHI